ncbi:hypothetical protein CkaCkLH20_08290 [Colletotrichum karsti]|uniref:Small secreted protein n=1 Tax=Colletotrichum karsti TaxID=1095194 RepID=A0A9P6LJ72_9PEZI|nr:uncharacterized protein CkaCkLH20_08290 [Colletotrichum karsti]KAF9874307.1 hypothetical protein CkaCkLH20_08290 [Colletotrichum karsti]
MHFTKSAVLLLSTAVSLAVALPTATQLERRAVAERPYADIQISDGVAGNAAAEAEAKFPVDPATATAEDLQVVKKASQLVGDAENLAFVPANDKSQEASNGFIKNKVLKNYLGLLSLQIQKAQGANVANIDTRIAGEQKKLTTNTNTDKQHAGQKSKGVAFNG